MAVKTASKICISAHAQTRHLDVPQAPSSAAGFTLVSENLAFEGFETRQTHEQTHAKRNSNRSSQIYSTIARNVHAQVLAGREIVARPLLGTTHLDSTIEEFCKHERQASVLRVTQIETTNLHEGNVDSFARRTNDHHLQLVGTAQND